MPRLGVDNHTGSDASVSFLRQDHFFHHALIDLSMGMLK
jgi:hypothetical protein